MQEALVGRVGAYYKDRGYGFLVQSSGENDLFFHRYEMHGDDPIEGGGNCNRNDKSRFDNPYDNAD